MIPSKTLSPQGLHVDKSDSPNMHTRRELPCAYLEPIRHSSHRSSTMGREVRPVLGRDEPFSESKKLGYRGSCVREYANPNRRRLRLSTRRERAADFYDCNKTKAVVSVCDDVPHFVRAARQVLERDDLTLEQRRKIADALSTRAIEFEVSTKIKTRSE